MAPIKWRYPLSALPVNTWQPIRIPLSALHVAGKPNCSGFWIQGSSGKAQSTFYVDDVQLEAAPLPALVHLRVEAGQVLQSVDARQFGLNTGTWDGSLGNSQTLPRLEESGCLALRWPGGSTSDEYHWAATRPEMPPSGMSPPIWALKFSPRSITAPALPARQPPGCSRPTRPIIAVSSIGK